MVPVGVIHPSEGERLEPIEVLNPLEESHQSTLNPLEERSQSQCSTLLEKD